MIDIQFIESPNEKKSACKDNYDCEKNKNFQKVTLEKKVYFYFHEKNDTLFLVFRRTENGRVN